MKAIIKFLFLIYAILAVSFELNCSNLGPVIDCGKGSSTEVAGILLEPDGKTPAQRASAVMRPRDYLAKIQMMGKRHAVGGFFVCSTYTDIAGYYRFTSDDSIPEGMYCIEGRDNDNNCVLIDSVAIAAGMSNAPFLDTLKPPARIQGKVSWNTDSSVTYVRVFGLNAAAKVKPDGAFSLDNLPQGDLRLHMLVFRHDLQFCDTEMVMVAAAAGDTAFVYPVTFDSRGGSAVAPQLAEYGGYATRPSPPTNKAVSFAGWFREPACSSEWKFTNDKVTSPTTLYAKWIVKDVDGNMYTTVKIGKQVWLVENLKTTRYNDSTAIPLVPNDTAWFNPTMRAYFGYNNNEAEYKNTYGALYNWYAVNTGKLAPAGWHVSTEADWDTLQDALLAQGYTWDGTTDNTIAKALAAQSDWVVSEIKGAIGNDLSKNNGSGFSALPGGSCHGTTLDALGQWGCWWTSRELNTSEAVFLDMNSYDIIVNRSQCLKACGFSVRCVRDD